MAPSSIASVASSEPLAIFGRYSDFCAALPPRLSADAATTLVARNGEGIRVRPISSITTPASTTPRLEPPNSSGTKRPAKPISAKDCQSSLENPAGSFESRRCRRCDTGALSLISPRALSRSMDCSSVRTRAMCLVPIRNLFLVRHSGMARRARPGIHQAAELMDEWIPGSRFARPGMTEWLTLPADPGCAWRRCRASLRWCRPRSNWPWCATRRVGGRPASTARSPIPAHRRRRPTSGSRGGAC